MKKYFTSADRDQLIYYQVPKVLIIGDKYKQMKSNAKLLYITLLDRMKLSLQNGWRDEHDRYYVRMSAEKGAELLGFSERTFLSMKKELIDYGLLEESRQGLNKTNLLFILQCDYSEDDIVRVNNEVDDMLIEAEKSAQNIDTARNRKSCDSRSAKVASQEPQKLRTNKNDLSKNDITKNEEFVNKEKPVNNDSNNQNEISSKDETIHKLSNEYRLKGMSKDLVQRVINEAQQKTGIKNFGGYLRSCLEGTLYRSNLKHGRIDITAICDELARKTGKPFYNFLEE